jgi:hypothetical protein
MTDRPSIADYLHAQPEPELRILGDWAEEYPGHPGMVAAQGHLDSEVADAAEWTVRIVSGSDARQPTAYLRGRGAAYPEQAACDRVDRSMREHLKATEAEFAS